VYTRLPTWGAFLCACLLRCVCNLARIPMRTTISVLCCVFAIVRTSSCVQLYLCCAACIQSRVHPHAYTSTSQHAQTSNRIFLSTLIIASVSMHTIARIASTHSLDRIASKQIHSRPPAHARAIAPPATVPLATTVPIRPPWNGSLLATVGVLLCGGCRSTRRRQNALPYAFELQNFTVEVLTFIASCYNEVVTCPCYEYSSTPACY